VQTGLFLIDNIRDWQWTWGHVGDTALHLLSLLPGGRYVSGAVDGVGGIIRRIGATAPAALTITK